VAIVDGEIDARETAALREQAQTLARDIEVLPFEFGPYREAFEAKWTRERYAALTRILSGVPVQWRYFIKHRIFDALDAHVETEGVNAEAIDLIFADLCASWPELQRAS
jgi:N-methylhydantoinase B